MILDTLKNLANTRKLAKEAKDAANALKKTLLANPEYVTAEQTAKEEAARAERLENTLRAEALGAFAQDGAKKADGYEIKDETTVELTDTDALRDWVIANFTPALVVDEKMVKEAALDGKIPARFFRKDTHPKVYIKSDLSNFA